MAKMLCRMESRLSGHSCVCLNATIIHREGVRVRDLVVAAACRVPSYAATFLDDLQDAAPAFALGEMSHATELKNGNQQNPAIKLYFLGPEVWTRSF